MSTPAPGTCELCKHWDEDARRKARVRSELEVTTGECGEIEDGISHMLSGRGHHMGTFTDQTFGCNLFAPLEAIE